MTLKRLELLAPARDYAAAAAAVDAGADAVYIGGARFGARHAAGNTVGEIRRVVEYAHLRFYRICHCRCCFVDTLADYTSEVSRSSILKI